MSHLRSSCTRPRPSMAPHLQILEEPAVSTSKRHYMQNGGEEKHVHKRMKNTEAGVSHGSKLESDCSQHAELEEDFGLRPELVSAIRQGGLAQLLLQLAECGCVPQSIAGKDVLCHASANKCRTVAFALSILQDLAVGDQSLHALVICASKQAAFDIRDQLQLLAKKFDSIEIAAVYGGTPIKKDRAMLAERRPHILIGPPGRLARLCEDSSVNIHFCTKAILDGCEQVLGTKDMRRDVEKMFTLLPSSRQVLVFGVQKDEHGTDIALSSDMIDVCLKFTTGSPQMVDLLQAHVD